MNTRLQVEHPVTEMIVKRDLVQWQLHVAAGHKLPAVQSVVSSSCSGHALEARIYAESPARNFLPHTGKLTHLRTPLPNEFTRIESGVRAGDEVSIYYDPMIAKLVVWGADRTQALTRMSDALRNYQIVGPPTNISFLQRAVAHPEFIKGQVTTNFIPNNLKDLIPETGDSILHEPVSLIVLSLLLREQEQAKLFSLTQADSTSPWSLCSNKRINDTGVRRFTLQKSQIQQDDKKVDTTVSILSNDNGSFIIKFSDGKESVISGIINKEGDLTATIDDKSINATFVEDKSKVNLFVDGDQFEYSLPQINFGRSIATGGGSISPMSGKIVKIVVSPKQHVKKGAPLAIMEAMKMEHVIRAPKDGIVDTVFFKAGDFVEGGKIVVSFVKEDS